MSNVNDSHCSKERKGAENVYQLKFQHNQNKMLMELNRFDISINNANY